MPGPPERPASSGEPAYFFPRSPFVHVDVHRDGTVQSLVPAHIADLNVALHWQANHHKSPARQIWPPCGPLDPSAQLDFRNERDEVVGSMVIHDNCGQYLLLPDSVWLTLTPQGRYRFDQIFQEMRRLEREKE